MNLPGYFVFSLKFKNHHQNFTRVWKEPLRSSSRPYKPVNATFQIREYGSSIVIWLKRGLRSSSRPYKPVNATFQIREYGSSAVIWLKRGLRSSSRPYKPVNATFQVREYGSRLLFG
ncbi:MAG: hypothetical protein DUD34_07625 [Lactobacillus sp.]|nr:MAG: hypothetical protein DUD34_07625 [Lactobacillus sp.]